MMNTKGRHFPKDVILTAVRWYLCYSLSYRHVEELLAERGVTVDHSTIARWVVAYSPLLLGQLRRKCLRAAPKWRMDETYICIKGEWCYFYRAVDRYGVTVDFYLSATRDQSAAQRFLRRACQQQGGPPHTITVDGHRPTQAAIRVLNRALERSHQRPITIRCSPYLNNMIEQDHRAIKRRVRATLGFKSFDTARATLDGIELAHMLRKGQLRGPRAALPLKAQFEYLAR